MLPVCPRRVKAVAFLTSNRYHETFAIRTPAPLPPHQMIELVPVSRTVLPLAGHPESLGCSPPAGPLRVRCFQQKGPLASARLARV